jgi:hypothetical protein
MKARSLEFFCILFVGLDSVGPVGQSFCLCRSFMTFEGWIRTPGAAVASGRASNLATHLSTLQLLEVYNVAI